MAVSGRGGGASAQIGGADECAAHFVQRGRRAHAFRIVGTADEAGVPGKAEVVGFVAVDLAGHATNSTGCCGGVWFLRNKVKIYKIKVPTLFRTKRERRAGHPDQSLPTEFFD